MKAFAGKGTGLSKKVRRINRDAFVFAFFVLLSFVFWYLNSLNKEAEAGIRYPVKYTNVPRGRTVVGREPEKLNLYLKGPGSSILKLKLSGKKAPVSVDISKVNYRRVPGSKEADYYVVTASLVRSLKIQLRTDCDITSVKPDTLFFTLGRVDPGQDQEKNRSGSR
ncbi:MAG TPA: hypothetical protein VHO68_06545 [Bacteroidales bacterium]|nr:hypothetical protein [Bacteroidales bacterium]